MFRHIGDKYDILLTLTKGLSAHIQCLSLLYLNQIKTPGNVQHLHTYRLSYLYFSFLSVLPLSTKILQASPIPRAVRAVLSFRLTGITTSLTRSSAQRPVRRESYSQRIPASSVQPARRKPQRSAAQQRPRSSSSRSGSEKAIGSHS